MVLPLLSTHVKEIGFSSTVVGVIGTVDYRIIIFLPHIKWALEGVNTCISKSG